MELKYVLFTNYKIIIYSLTNEALKNRRIKTVDSKSQIDSRK